MYEGLIASGDLSIWIEREKNRKSNVILQLCMSAALGRDFLQFKFSAQRPLKVVLLDFESKTWSLKMRIRGMTPAMELDEESIAMLWRNLRIIEFRKVLRSGIAIPKFPAPHLRGARMSPAELQASAGFWEDVAQLYAADLYIIDPLRTLHSGDENDSSIEALLSEIRRRISQFCRDCGSLHA